MEEITIKEFLLAGGSLKMPYKAEPTDWVGDATLHIFSGGMGMKPKISIHGDAGWHDFKVDELDAAIERFKELTMTEKNLWYKMQEVMLELHAEGKGIDLDDDDHREFAFKRRKQKFDKQ